MSQVQIKAKSMSTNSPYKSLRETIWSSPFFKAANKLPKLSLRTSLSKFINNRS